MRGWLQPREGEAGRELRLKNERVGKKTEPRVLVCPDRREGRRDRRGEVGRQKGRGRGKGGRRKKGG